MLRLAVPARSRGDAAPRQLDCVEMDLFTTGLIDAAGGDATIHFLSRFTNLYCGVATITNGVEGTAVACR